MYQPHEELGGLVQPVLEEHFEAYLRGSTDKNNTPLYLFLGGAGTGKSKNAMEFPQTLISCANGDSDLRGRLMKAKVFLVSLENGTSITSLEEDRNMDPLQIVGTRMLLQLLHGETYFGVDRVLQEFEPPWPIEVLQAVAQGEGEDLYHEFTGIIIVDGVQNFLDGQSKESKFYRTLTRIAELALQPHKSVFVVPCCTATKTIPTHQFLASSHRNRVCLPLKSLDPPMIAVENGDLVPVFSQSDCLIRLLVIDCGGHARALEALHSAIDAKKVAQIGVNNTLQRIHQRLANRYSEAIRLVSDKFLAVLRAVWIRLPLREDERIPGTEMTVEQAIQPGLIRFESDGRQSGYLTAPYIWVWLILKSPNNNLDALIRDWLFWDYADTYNLLNGDPSPGMRTWQNFESHCARIRAIKSKVFGDGCVTKLSSVHFGARLNGDREIQNLPLDVRLATRRHSTKTTRANRSSWEVECCDGEVVDVRACRDCIVNAASASAGDFFVGLQAPDGSSTGVEVCQCKYHTADNVTQALFRQEYKKSVSAQDFFMLFTTVETSNFTLPKNSGIVDAGNWFDYFGPWASRLLMFHQLILGDGRPSPADQKKRERKSTDYNYGAIVNGKKPSLKCEQ